jgi:predicted HD superfamily hydrolase involved in NAD metabolism
MMELNEIIKRLEKMLPAGRFNHSLEVMKSSIRLAEKYGEDVEKAALAGLVHDCAKNLGKDDILNACRKYGIIVDEITSSAPALLHGQVGAHVAQELFGIDDPEILDAIADHTMGRPGMNKLSSIVFIADYIEDTRDFDEVDIIRAAAEESLEKAIVAGIDSTIRHILIKGRMLHPQTIATRNWALKQLSKLKTGDAQR